MNAPLQDDVLSQVLLADRPPGQHSPADEPPEGFHPMNRGGPYFNQLGGLYAKANGRGGVVIGLRLREPHTNMRGVTHGGMLLTLADGALGINLSMARQPRQPMVTVSLTSDFLGSAKVGQWLEAHVTVRKQGARLSFADCELKVGDHPVLRCSATFIVVGAPRPDASSDG